MEQVQCWRVDVMDPRGNMDPRGSSAYVGGVVVLGRGNRQDLRLDQTCHHARCMSLNPLSITL